MLPFWKKIVIHQSCVQCAAVGRVFVGAEAAINVGSGLVGTPDTGAGPGRAIKPGLVTRDILPPTLSPGHHSSVSSVMADMDNDKCDTPLQSAVTYFCNNRYFVVCLISWNYLYYVQSNALPRVGEAWEVGQKLSDIYISQSDILCEKNIFHVKTDVYLWEPPVMSISDFCFDFLSCVDILGLCGYIIIFHQTRRILHSQSQAHMYHSKSKERNLVLKTFMKRIKIHFFPLIPFHF